ncbi:MAG: tetratricopeptide repeat protein [Rhodobacteraceae bacterium]|nr:tetratricopeptide repeat protein [Paracoccaceae bacterium]
MARQIGAKPAVILLCAALALAGCKNKQEKADAYYQSALALAAKGDIPRAMIELRNVFEYDNSHKAARREYGDLLLATGRVQEAYSQYLRLSEQYPDLVDPHRILAELSLRSGNIDEARRQMNTTLDLAPDDPGALAVGLALKLRTAMARNETSAYGDIATQARALAQRAPDIATAWHVLIDTLNAQGDQEGALRALDSALAQKPAQYRLQVMRLELLAALKRNDQIGAQLKRMQELFPDDPKTRTALIAWYVLRDDPDGAANFLRKLAGDPASETEGYVQLVQFLAQSRGVDAAAKELDTLITQAKGTPNARLFGAMRADLDFTAGRQDAALARMKTLLTDAPESEQTDRLRVSYAQMLDHAGQREAAQSELDAALKAAPDLVAALRLRAQWLIEDDNPQDALVALRRALQQAPQDAPTLTLMAQANLREGAPDLAGARLAQAYEATDHGATEARNYADFLLSQKRTTAAGALLSEAIQRNPDDPGLLHRQADLALRQTDWAQAQRIANHLDTLKRPEAAALAQSIRAAILLGRGQSDAAIDTLKSLADSTSNNGAIAAVIQAQLAAGRADAAHSYLADQLAATPKDRGLRLLSANLDALTGQGKAAEAGLRALLSERPADSQPARQLYRLLAAAGRDEDAAQIIDTTLAAQGDAPDPLLLLYRARSQEKAGQYEAAIATYDALYQRNSDNAVLANNLASLLSQHRDDKPSLERAARIAQRFRESPEPAFKDTYGWAEYRLGNFAQAEPLLAAAAAGLPDTALTQYHYAMVLAANGEDAKAAQQLQKALDLAGTDMPAQMKDAPAKLKALQAGAKSGN